jgi:universal stress protein E
MQRLDRILAVIDPTVDAQVGAAKAAQLARGTGAALELFTCDFDPSLSGAPFFDTEALRRLREEFVGRRAVVLDALAAEMRTTGLEVTTRVHWDNPLHAGILRRVAEWTPDLVVKDTHHHPPLKRTLLSNTDWTLIRACPVPLLLAKAAPWPAEPCIVAALDPGHRRDEPPAKATSWMRHSCSPGCWGGVSKPCMHSCRRSCWRRPPDRSACKSAPMK